MPTELFNDPIFSRALLDDESFYSDPTSYGVDDMFKGDTKEMDEIQARLVDPLANFPFLQRLRDLYLDQHPLAGPEGGMERGILDYIRYKALCVDLLMIASEYWVAHGSVQDWDWESISQSISSDPTSVAESMRLRLAMLALEEIMRTLR